MNGNYIVVLETVEDEFAFTEEPKEEMIFYKKDESLRKVALICYLLS